MQSFPNYSLTEIKDRSISLITKDDIFSDTFENTYGIPFDINRVSSRNARKNELGPYKNSFLREIINSHGMGKTGGTKKDLVDTILKYRESINK